MTWDELFAAAERSGPGAGGVSVLPFLSGERGAVAGPAMRGSWLGLSDTTSREDLARAAVEGMVFAVAQGVRLLAGSPEIVRMTGGGARQRMVPQLLADALQAEVRVVPERSASALGAAMLAASGVGVSVPAPHVAADVVDPGAPLPAFDVWRDRLSTAGQRDRW
jgi:xylulokinase